MPESTGKNYSVYFNSELVEKFEIVQRHLGKGISQTLAHLVEAKEMEIKDGLTRRDQVAAIRDELAEYHFVETAYLKAILEKLTHDATDRNTHP